jgi:hypothetical protein
MNKPLQHSASDVRWRQPADNPFSTRYVRPGAIRYLFTDGLDAGRLLKRLEDLGGRAQIVGPHGSGKSTLVAELVAAMAAAGCHAHVVVLRDGERRMPTDWLAQAEHAAARMVIVDGYEQLGAWSRFWLKRCCRRRNLELLVTSHATVGLPTLFTTRTSVELARSIVLRLSKEGQFAVPPDAVAAYYHASGGNLRETLFALYDDYERRGAVDLRA